MLSENDIVLRALEPTDLETLFKWENDSSIWEVSQTLVPFSRYVLSQYLKNQHLDIFTTKQLRLVIEQKEEPLGLIDLFDFDPHNSRAGIGILIASASERGKGIGKKALALLCEYASGHLGLKQVYANITTDNPASIALFEGYGFRLTGTKKAWVKKGTQFVDESLYQFIF